MAKSGSMRWRGWRTSTSGTDVQGLPPRRCKKCKRSFRPRKAKHRLCQSCVTRIREEAQFKRIGKKKAGHRAYKNTGPPGSLL